MNFIWLHVAINHMATVGGMFACIALLFAIRSKKSSAQKLALTLGIIAGLSVVPVYFSGEEAEEALEHSEHSHISLAAIHEHEDMAPFAAISMVVAGVICALTLFKLRSQKTRTFTSSKTPTLLWASLAAMVVATLLCVYTSNLGGKIAHAELRDASIAPNQTQSDKD
jgi:hypothetical protein